VCRDVFFFFEKEVAFRRSRGSRMQIDSETWEEMVSSLLHPSVVQREPVEPMETIEHVDPIHPIYVPRDIVVGQHRKGVVTAIESCHLNDDISEALETLYLLNLKEED
jgi:hypothetical protein